MKSGICRMWDETLAEGLGVQQVRAGGTEPADSDDAPGSVFVSLKATSWTASFIYPFFFFLVMILKQERTKKKIPLLVSLFVFRQNRKEVFFSLTSHREGGASKSGGQFWPPGGVWQDLRVWV